MKLLPRALASLSLALTAVPGAAPLTASADAAAPASPMPMIPAPLPGGWTEQNPDSPAVRHVTTFAVTMLSEEFGHPYVVPRIREAESQVIDGIDYRLRFSIAEADDKILGTRKDCTVYVWSRPWLNPPNVLTSFDCQAVPSVS